MSASRLVRLLPVLLLLLPSLHAAVFDITTYGCVGDGVTDNRSCFQNALDAASAAKGSLYVPAGTYLFSTHSGGVIIANKPNVTIYGDGEGSVLKYGSFGATDVELFKGTADNVTVRDLTFDMNGANNLTGGTQPLKGALRFGSGTDNLTVERCTFRDASGARVISVGDTVPNNQTNIIIRQNRFHRVADTLPSNGSMPDHSTIYAEADRLVINDNQFVNDSQSIAATAIEIHARNGEAIGNQIKNYNLGVIVASIYGTTAYNVSVLGNEMESVRGGVRAYIDGNNSTMKNLDISHNVITSTTAVFPLIELGSDVLNTGGDVRVADNRLQYIGSPTGNLLGPGINIGRWTSVVIHHNTMRDLAGRGIELSQTYPPNGDETSVLIEGNSLHNTNRNSVGGSGSTAIFLSHANRLLALRILDNECANAATGSPADFPATPIATCVDGNSPTRRLSIRGNLCSGPTTCASWYGTAPTTTESEQTNQRFELGSLAFGSLGSPANGTIVYCTDCTATNPCAGSGSGALAKRIAGGWVCN